MRKSAMLRAARVADQAQIRTEFSMPRGSLVDTYFLIRVSCQGCYITFLFLGRKGKNPNSDARNLWRALHFSCWTRHGKAGRAYGLC